MVSDPQIGSIQRKAVKAPALLLALIALGGIFAASCSQSRTPAPVQGRAEGSQDLLLALRDLHFDRYLDQPDFHPQKSDFLNWDMYSYPENELKCIEGGKFFLLARKGKLADRTVIWLEGGGACYPGRDDCRKAAQFYDYVEENGLASPEMKNPVKTWNFVYVPYCDGSLHLGDNDADYDRDGAPDHWHWGLKSSSAAVRLAQELFPDTQKALVAGCSAGGSGTIGVAPLVRLAFPQAQLVVLNISGLGLVDPAQADLPPLLKETWNIGQLVPPDCPRCDQQLTYLYDWLLERDARLKVGVYSTYLDALASKDKGMTPQDFRSLILSVTDAIHQEHPDTFERFFVKGEGHCLSDYTVKAGGVSFWDWVRYLVEDDPHWVDILE